MAEQDARMMVRADFKAIAGITATDVRVSPRWQATATRAVGTALNEDGTPHLTPQGGATVKVTYADGTMAYKPASSFKKERAQKSIRKNRAAARIIETARLSHGHNFNS
jgi:hypothetical protein